LEERSDVSEGTESKCNWYHPSLAMLVGRKKGNLTER
jgi:hypothetical protein